MHRKDNLEEKTREEADIRIYHISSHSFLRRLRCAVMMLVDYFFIFIHSLVSFGRIHKGLRHKLW